MKSVTFAEFDDIVQEAQQYIGAKIEDVVIDNDILILSLRGRGVLSSLVIDLRSRTPVFIITDRKTPRLKKETKPIVLFLKAHAIGLPLVSISRNKEYGRLIKCVFGRDDNKLVLEAHLFPQGKNIKVETAESSMCLKKPQELTKVEPQTKVFDKRSLDEIYQEWMAQFEKQPVVSGKEESPEILKAQALYKKQIGLDKLLENRKVLEESLWPEFAEWLNLERTEDVPKKYAKLYDSEKSVVQNIERAFAETKKIKSKMNGVDERIRDLEKEMEQLRSGEVMARKPARVAESPLQGAKGRTREFSDGIRAYIGKSGTDNLKLLRQSKAWYVWVHAKDWPSAHAIIAINKGQQVPPQVLRDVCLWVLKETISDKQWQSWLGIKVDFLYTERRFLQAIKGDHHGRVRYTEAKTLTVVVE